MYKIYRQRFAEVLLETVSGIDDKMLFEALITDSEEALKELKKTEKKAKRNKCLGEKRFMKIVACMASLVLVIGVAISGFTYKNNESEILPWDGFEIDLNGVKISSLDMLNYYCGRRVLASYTTGNMQGKEIALASKNICVEVEVVEEKNNVQNPLKVGDSTGNVVYYSFDPSESILVTKVIYFKADLKEKCGFLAEKLGGMGPIDVIITDNSIEEMITFRRGDRYYSCLLNGCVNESGVTYLEFSTHKYVDGFCVVKNMEQDNYKFKVKLDDNTVKELDCDYDETLDGNWDVEADRIGMVEGSSRFINTSATFNLSELESFFNTETSSITEVVAWIDRRAW